MFTNQVHNTRSTGTESAGAGNQWSLFLRYYDKSLPCIEMKKWILVVFFLFLYVLGMGQQATSDQFNSQQETPVDGFYEKSDIANRKVVPYAPIRSGDVLFSKRIWRVIDLRERLNTIFMSPKSNLVQILWDAVQAGELTAYDPTPNPLKDDPNGDRFKTPIDPSELISRYADSVAVPIIDNETGEQITTRMVAGELNPESISAFRIKEDWIFDKHRSVWEPRIIGIAPLIKVDVEGFEDLDIEPIPAFWVYFPEARYILVNHEVVNRHNDATGLTYDDVFIKRIFSSYIIKESNPDDISIRDMKRNGRLLTKEERLLESERIKRELMDFEQDLWSY